MNPYQAKLLKSLPKSAILWEGNSNLDGSPIAVIVTGLRLDSANPKSPGAQCWIISAGDLSPSASAAQGLDASICGTCPRRPINYKNAGYSPCYVKLFKAPRSVYAAYKADKYPHFTESNWQTLAKLGKNYPIRFGAYGDPAAVPEAAGLWQRLASLVKHTSFTHQWRNEKAAYLKGLCQASCDNLLDYVEASSDGWGTFRVAAKTGPGTWEKNRNRTEAHCAASEEKGNKTNCATCSLCNGQNAVFINAH